MPKCLIQARATVEGAKGLLKEGGTSRRAAIEKLVKSLGGTLEASCYAFGETDEYITADLPDNAAMAAALVGIAGGASTVKTTVLITPEEIDQAIKKSPTYRPPGQ